MGVRVLGQPLGAQGREARGGDHGCLLGFGIPLAVQLLELVGGEMHLTGDIEEMPLPADLPAVLGERFDRLPQKGKRVAYAGAVIGESFATPRSSAPLLT